MKRVVLVIWVCLALSCVTKAEFQPYQESLRDLEQEMDQLEKRLPEISGSLREDQANIKADMIDIRTEMQQLRGELSSGLHESEVEGQERQSVEEPVALQVRGIFTKLGGNLGENGSVTWMFDSKGVITINAEGIDTDELQLSAIDAGAEDVKVENGTWVLAQ